jgi:hypothetical protein
MNRERRKLRRPAATFVWRPVFGAFGDALFDPACRTGLFPLRLALGTATFWSSVDFPFENFVPYIERARPLCCSIDRYRTIQPHELYDNRFYQH